MPLTAGTRLGPYEILAPLGAGGMGEVYRARDSRLGRDVAIKVLPEHLSGDPLALARFEREARAVAALSHPNILAIYDVGADQGVSYVVTELLEGDTLRSRVTAAALAWRKSVEIAVALADGLSAAHSKGITHRDLKPENIFLTTDGRAKILDFGLARVHQPAAAAETNAPTETDAGMILGTVGYMSPEQVRGTPADARSDIFSLGCVLYEMVSGRRAFSRSTPAETMTAILRENPPELAGTGKQIPAELDRVIQHCLEKSPAERFQSARDLGFHLSAILTGAAAAKPAAALDSLAVLPFVNAGGNPDTEYLSDGITESLINSLSQLPKLRVVPRSRAFRYKGQEVDPKKVGRQLKVRALLTGRVAQRGETLSVQAELVDVSEDAQLWGERYTRQMSDIFSVEEEIARAITEKLRLKLSGEEEKQLGKRQTENSEAYQLYLKGRFHWGRRTEEHLKRGIDYFQQAVDKDPDYALACAGSSDCYALLALFGVGPPKDLGAKAAAAARKAVELDDTLAEAHTSLGFCKWIYDWDYAGAEREFQRAIALKPGSWQAHSWYGVTLSAAGRADEAVAEVRQALALEPLSLVAQHHAALIFLQIRRYEEAVEHCRKTLELDPNYALSHYWLAVACEQKSLFDEAVSEFEKAAQLFQRSPIGLGGLGHGYAAAGRKQDAEQILIELEELSRKRYVDPFQVALVCVGLGDKDRAFEWLRRASDERSGFLAIYLRSFPWLDPLRSDPRYADLARRINAPL